MRPAIAVMAITPALGTVLSASPEPGIKLYYTDNVIMLPNEY
jgi:hypothetical protein